MRKICLILNFVLVGLFSTKSYHAVAQGTTDSCAANFETQSANAAPLGKYFFAQLWNSANKKPLRICWNFGDNHDTCIYYTTSYTGGYATYHLYAQAGNYNVCVNILYDGGCEAHQCKLTQVGDVTTCAANFETQNSTSTPLGKYFIAQPSNSANKKPVRICWTFGDNHDTCIQYSTSFTGTYGTYHQYANAGTYTVCVNILYDGGCEAHLCKSVTAGDGDSCSANFETVSSTATLLGKYFIAQPWNSHNKKPVRICWTFGDNHDTCIQYLTSFTGTYGVFHQYGQPGVYNVCVKILYDGGCEALKCKIIAAGNNDSCSADFERIPNLNNDPLRVYYRALPWNSNQRKPQRICWIFGDGKDTCIEYPENFTGQYVVAHNYPHTGTYQVCVKIKYYGGCEAQKCKAITLVGTGDCSVNILEATTSLSSVTRTFYAATSNSGGVQRICWYFGDGTDTCILATASTPPSLSVTHTFPGPGAYRVCVKVLYANGCLAEKCKEISIEAHTGICGGYYTDSMINQHTYAFKGFSIHRPNDVVVGYRWTFGDGTSGIGQQVIHSYAQPGIYRVCLVVNTQEGCEAKICDNVRVAGTTQTTLTVSPNPVVNVVHALFHSSFNENVTINIVNSMGLVVRTYTRNAVVGPNAWDFDLSSLSTGVYSMVVISPNQFASAIFFKL
jgi:PKD repeat protein